MPRVGFELTIPASERAKTVDALERSATVTGKRKFLFLPGLELRPLRRPARSQSLYRLRYPGLALDKGKILKLIAVKQDVRE
jgi:hypothetical protein